MFIALRTGFMCFFLALVQGNTPVLSDDWNISNPPGFAKNITIEADEGTWMNLDVSPDGKWIIFDFLGDIYSMDIRGGTPDILSEGISFDTQPRFSPDGKNIAFISDRSGADNVWVMEKSGANPKQLTHEIFRKPSAPVWSPDGRHIAVRKHYTGSGTIAAGEIWLFPVSGGEGHVLVKRGEREKEAGEPFFAPDGKTLYFSRDNWPGRGFGYDRDVHKGIFAIEAVDIATGKAVVVISGPGGAVRPTPSPDGRWLAYVKRAGIDRTGYPSALVVHDLQSGTEHIVYDRLDRDMQELWSNHGFYPAFDWTADSRDLVFWAGGKIRKIRLGKKKADIIPFHIRRTYGVREPFRAKVKVAPPQFPVRALRWVRVSPNGKKVIYQALGYIYVQDMESGEARRLTRNEHLFEFYPDFSADGQWVVYTTWNDQKLGSVRRTHISDGSTVILTREPGHYIEPAVSFDMKSVTFRRAGPTPLLDPAWSKKAGLYRVDWKGGPQDEVTSFPQYCTKTPKDIVRREYAKQYRLSPDCKWLGYIERGEVYVVRLETGKLFQAPGDGGAFLSWSADNQLHWALGPHLYSWSFGPSTPTGNVSQRPIGFTGQRVVKTGVTALTGGRIITLNGQEVIENGTLIITGNRISAVGRSDEIIIPPEAVVIDIEGKTVIPGLIDSHFHGPNTGNGIHPQQNWNYYATLAFGVTTIFNPYVESYDIFSTAELEKTGRITAPRIYSTGTPLYGATSDFTAIINNYKDALKQVRRRKVLGAIAVKSYLLPRRAQRQQVIAAARELGLFVSTESAMAIMNGTAQIMDGVASLEHAMSLDNIYEDVVQLWRQSGVDTVPTLIVGLGGMGGENYWYPEAKLVDHPILSRFVPPDKLAAETIRKIKAPKDGFSVIQSAKWLARLQKEGVRVLAGGHGQREGLGLHWEMWLMSAGGMAAMDVLRAATLDGAIHLGMGDDLGSLERGKLADMVILAANPLDDIKNTQTVRYVIKDGRVFEARSMDEVGRKNRATFFWEKKRPLSIP